MKLSDSVLSDIVTEMSDYDIRNLYQNQKHFNTNNSPCYNLMIADHFFYLPS